MTTAILTIILFCVMIFPHELGHFIAAKKMDVKVNEFAFGMGPKLWKKQRGETLHSIRLFPIGGFCAMEGEDGESDEPRAFGNKKPWQKIIILAAGSFMNVVCAIVIMIIISGIAGFTTNLVGELTQDGAAQKAGIHEGDEIVRIDDNKVDSWEDISNIVSKSTGEPMEVEIQKGR
jgi:Predicted membrane-associated Zn-dependent proteases 1